jgi:hypothetical protein
MFVKGNRPPDAGNFKLLEPDQKQAGGKQRDGIRLPGVHPAKPGGGTEKNSLALTGGEWFYYKPAPEQQGLRYFSQSKKPADPEKRAGDAKSPRSNAVTLMPLMKVAGLPVLNGTKVEPDLRKQLLDGEISMAMYDRELRKLSPQKLVALMKKHYDQPKPTEAKKVSPLANRVNCQKFERTVDGRLIVPDIIRYGDTVTSNKEDSV